MGQNEVKIVLTTDASGMVTGFKTATGEMVSFGKATKETGDHSSQAGQSIAGLTKNVAELTLGLVGVKSAVDVVKGSLSYLGQIETATLGIGSSFMTSGKYIDQVSGKVPHRPGISKSCPGRRKTDHGRIAGGKLSDHSHP